jgi:hypothetical protein
MQIYDPDPTTFFFVKNLSPKLFRCLKYFCTGELREVTTGQPKFTTVSPKLPPRIFSAGILP